MQPRLDKLLGALLNPLLRRGDVRWGLQGVPLLDAQGLLLVDERLRRFHRLLCRGPAVLLRRQRRSGRRFVIGRRARQTGNGQQHRHHYEPSSLQTLDLS